MDTPQIKVSSNYDEFRFIEANREQKRGHVESLKKAFEEVGNLTKVQPILVNENMEIIDGQHRFTACQELNEPIYYTQVDGLRVGDARKMNVLHRGWLIEDYAQSFAKTDPNYRKYLDIKEDYGFSHGNTLVYILNTDSKDKARGIGKTFRSGEFVLEDEKGARERLEKLAEVGQYVTFVNDISFARAILRVINLEGFDFKRLLHKLELHQNLLRRYATIEDYLRMLEEIYNFQMAETNRVRLY